MSVLSDSSLMRKKQENNAVGDKTLPKVKKQFQMRRNISKCEETLPNVKKHNQMWGNIAKCAEAWTGSLQHTSDIRTLFTAKFLELAIDPKLLKNLNCKHSITRKSWDQILLEGFIFEKYSVPSKKPLDDHDIDEMTIAFCFLRNLVVLWQCLHVCCLWAFF